MRASRKKVSYVCIGALSFVVGACEAYEPPPLPTTPSNPAASTVPTNIVLTASSTFKQQLAVDAMVLSADGHGIPNVVVTFSVDNGSISPVTAATDSSGNALSTAVTTTGTTVRATIGGGINASVNVLPSVQVPQ
jgi:hypothetical protein